MAKSRMRAKIPELRDALAGRFNAHHALLCRAMLARIDQADTTIAQLTERIVALQDPHEAAVTLLVGIPGVSHRTAQVILAEIGTDMSRSPPPVTWSRGGHVPRQQRVGRQAPLRAHPLRLQVVAHRPRRGRPGRRAARRAHTSPPTTPASGAVGGQRGPRSPWVTPSSSSHGTCCPPARPTPIWAGTTSTSGGRAPPTNGASSPSSKPWATRSPLSRLPDPPRLSGLRPDLGLFPVSPVRRDRK